jgi:hypothetical protein
MQTPSMDTRVSKCIEIATHSIRMFGKFPANAVLTALAVEMTTAKDNLAAAQQHYEAAVQAILPARVDVKYENHVSDRRVRLVQQKVEIADGKKNGRIAALVFPDGSTTITKLSGDSQINAMSDLEGRLESVVSLWPDAATEKADIAKNREAYAAALKYRNDLEQIVRNKRALRNAAKEVFITKYAEIASRVAAEFPRDSVMQDLFFDEVRAKSALAEADEDESNDSSAENTDETKTS